MIIASIDIGTNTVLLLIAEVNNELQLRSLVDEYRIPRIGKGLLPDGKISEDKIKELINILSEYKRIIELYDCKRIIITATNAMRIAANSDQIVAIIKDQFGWGVNIVSGKEEAGLSYLGAVSGYSAHSNMLVIDIGGGSTELIFGKRTEIEFIKSFAIGVVSGTEKYLKNDPPTCEQLVNLREHLQTVLGELGTLDFRPDISIALAGTPTTLACMELNLNNYDEKLIENYALSYNKINKIVNTIQKITYDEIKNTYRSVVKGREDIILAGGIILLKIMELIKVDSIRVNTKGIRYGAIIKEFTKCI
jgi:exopolyphosphatase / guanosine-5'-triphosphate,3'-diphosphate pyrophosphatase